MAMLTTSRIASAAFKARREGMVISDSGFQISDLKFRIVIRFPRTSGQKKSETEILNPKSYSVLATSSIL
jgi:hypothetical protein